MDNCLKVFTIALAISFSGSILFSQEKRASSTSLTISSEGELKVPPDQVEVAIHFTGYGWTVEKSRKKVDTLIQKFKQKLDAAKIFPKEIEIGEVRLKPSYQFNRDLKKDVPSNFLATRKILLHLSDKNSFTKLMELSLSIGSFVLESAKLTVSGKKELSQKAFERSLAEGKVKAEALAKKLGKEVSDISNIVEEWVTIQELNLIQEMFFPPLAGAALSQKEPAAEIGTGSLTFPEEEIKSSETQMDKAEGVAMDQISARARLRITYQLQ